jgi:hypothetical protein
LPGDVLALTVANEKPAICRERIHAAGLEFTAACATIPRQSQGLNARGDSVYFFGSAKSGNVPISY